MCRKEIHNVEHSSALRKPSLLARYTCAGISCAIFAMWWKFTFVPENMTPGVQVPMHSCYTTLALTLGYLVSLPILKQFVQRYCSTIDMKDLLTESMILYNVSQIGLNGWMVWRFVDAVVNKEHPFVGDISTISSGAYYAVWIHYCDKYLEFFDTYFMVLRGRMDQVWHKCLQFLYLVWRVMDIELFLPFSSTGIFPSCLSSFFNCMGMVFSNTFISRRRCVLWCIVELFHPCTDVFILCISIIENTLSMEKISYTSTTTSVRFSNSLFCI